MGHDRERRLQGRLCDSYDSGLDCPQSHVKSGSPTGLCSQVGLSGSDWVTRALIPLWIDPLKVSLGGSGN